MDQSQKNQALVDAAHAGDLAQVKAWIEQGADLHAEGEFALRGAAANGHLSMVRYLVEQGADLEVGLTAARREETVRAVPWLEGIQRSREEALLLTTILESSGASLAPPRLRM